MLPLFSIARIALLLQIAGAPIPSTGAAHVIDSQSSELNKVVAAWFAQLADPDPAHRDSAAEDLMGLTIDEMPALVEAVKATHIVAPSQQIALHDIVMQIYLASRDYPRANGSAGFLGVQLAPSYEQIRFSPTTDSDGAIVYGRIPGFIAYRRLRDGDFIVGIADVPMRVANRDQLVERIRQFRAGDVVHLNIQRGGKEVVVPIRLDPRPVEGIAVPYIAGSINHLGGGAFVTIGILPNIPITVLRDNQKPRADEFWEENFAPLFSTSGKNASVN